MLKKTSWKKSWSHPEIVVEFHQCDKKKLQDQIDNDGSDAVDLEENGADEPVSAEKRKLVVVLFRSHLRDNRDIFHLKMNFVSEWLDLIIFSATVALAVKTAQEIWPILSHPIKPQH